MFPCFTNRMFIAVLHVVYNHASTKPCGFQGAAKVCLILHMHGHTVMHPRIAVFVCIFLSSAWTETGVR